MTSADPLPERLTDVGAPLISERTISWCRVIFVSSLYIVMVDARMGRLHYLVHIGWVGEGHDPVWLRD